MARQAGDTKITGTIDDLCYYKMDGQYYVRMKSSLTGKRFWRDTAFEGSRKSSGRFSEGNKLASRVYAMIEENKRVYGIFCFLKRRAIQLLKEGRVLEEVEQFLVDYLVDFGLLKKDKRKDTAAINRNIKRNISEHKDIATVFPRALNNTCQSSLMQSIPFFSSA